MQAAGAAESHQSEVSWVMAFFYRYQAQGRLHIGIGDIQDPLGCFYGCANSDFPCKFFEPGPQLPALEVEKTSERVRRVQLAGKKIRVRDCDPVSFAIADRSGFGACAFGPDA